MRGTVDFLLHDWLRVTELTARPRFAEHSAETFAQVLDTCERIAREKLAPFNRLVGMLTTGNANLLMAHGTPLQKQVFAANDFSGRWSGTMCLSEPQAGSSLSDVATRAEADDAPEAAYADAGETMACNFADASAQDGVSAFLRKRKPRWAGG